ncbi:MAG: glycoside hydrolase family 76 protein [Dermatophilaceae bacterium]
MTSESEARAATAAASVRHLFGRRLFGLPGTYLPHVAVPSSGRFGPWQYWWLAHFVDCLVDESERERAAGSPQTAEYAVRLAYRLLRTIRLRNGMRFTNHYYDDMGWLLLATQRLHDLGLRHPPRPSDRALTSAALHELAAAVASGETSDFRGGVYWNDKRDFKNVAATGPVGLYLARSGDREHAAQVADWLYATLFNPRSGLLDDGVRREPDGRTSIASGTYTYNQGIVLGLLVELADERSLTRAAQLVAAITEGMSTGRDGAVLLTHGGGDGGLFTGIAARYLALAARCPSLATPARRRAAGLVRDTADALWAGRSALSSGGRIPPHGGHPSTTPVCVFPPDPAGRSAADRPFDDPVELSTQLQAWTVFEAAQTLDQH